MTTTVFVLSSITAHKASFIFVNIVTHCNLKEGAEPYREWSFSLENKQRRSEAHFMCLERKAKVQQSIQKGQCHSNSSKNSVSGPWGPSLPVPYPFQHSPWCLTGTLGDGARAAPRRGAGMGLGHNPALPAPWEAAHGPHPT